MVDAWTAEISSAFESEYASAAAYIPAPQEWLASNWQGDALGGAGESRSVVATGLPLETLKQVVSRTSNNGVEHMEGANASLLSV